jgi:pimeloyl-ACP methyl ester carboxylesterase
MYDGRALRARLLLLGLLLLPGCAPGSAPSAIDRLRPCTSDEGPTDAYCGSYTVFEDRDARQGRTLDLRIVVLPALGNDAQPDPLFFLAGGPGQGAAQMARGLRELFRRLQTQRDIVLVDQRGTGKSAPLDCTTDTNSLRVLNESDEEALARLKACMTGFDADLRLYTTTIAMDDLDEVRAHLGYDRINVYGGSYGTRAALVYLRRHEPHVRAVVLDGVAPTDMRLPLFFARDAQRALDRLFGDCEADQTCRSLYPDLAARTRRLFERLDRAPVRVRLTHPRTGEVGEVTINTAFVGNIVFAALYSPMMSSIVPELLKRAEADDFQGLLALALVNEAAGDNMAVGMQLSVICAEDYPRISATDVARESEGQVFGGHLLTARMKACEFWPKGEVERAYYEPIRSDVPVLLLSGDLDPVTPPSWAEQVARHLSNSRHLVVPGTGHGVLTTGCGARLVRQFIERGSVEGLDTSCVDTIRRPPFFLSPAGPDPAAVSSGSGR